MRRTTTATGLALLCAATAHANNERRITPDEPLYICFEVEAGATPVPDTLVVYLGEVEATAATGARAARLSDSSGLFLGEHISTAFGDVVGTFDLEPGITYRTAGSAYEVLEPAVVDMSALIDGTPRAEVVLSVTSGELIVDLDEIRVEWGTADGPDSFTPSDIQPEITDLYVGSPCYADFDRSGTLDVFDFLAYQNAFGVGDYRADCDGCGSLNIFDFLCFLSMFDDGCPE